MSGVSHHADDAGGKIAFLRSLRAVRAFRPDPVPQGVIDDVLEVVRWSGSAKNLQPWEVVVVRVRETLEALSRAEGYAGHLAGATLGMVLIMNGESAEQETYDEGRLSERIMLAAAAHGVGACIGWFRGRGPEEVRLVLGIPEGRLVRTALSLGYPAAGAGRRSSLPGRKPLAEFVHLERYGDRRPEDRTRGPM